MITRYFKHGDGRKWIDIEGVGFLEFDGGRWCFYGCRAKFYGCTASLRTNDLIECDANWQPLPVNKPLDPPLVKVREWVSDAPAWTGNRWRKEGGGPMMYYSDYGQWFEVDWDADTMGERLLKPYEVHPGTRIPIDQPLPYRPGYVVPANEAKPTAEKTELDECIEWLESPEQQAAKLSFACSMVTNGLREVNRRIDNIERRLAIKDQSS